MASFMPTNLVLPGLLVISLSTGVQAQSPPASSDVALPTAAEMQRVLRQQIPDLAAREQAASANVKQNLEQIRARLVLSGAKFSVGFTPALELPLEALAGTRIPRSAPGLTEVVNSRAAQLRQIDIQSASKLNIDISKIHVPLCSPRAANFDWRKHGKVTPVKTQICGTCWDFTAMGAYEGSYALRNNQQINASEQYVLNCSGAGGCSGGWWMPVFDYMVTHGTAQESDYPFTGNDAQSCPTGVATPYRATSWGFVGADYTQIPSVAAIKDALCTHGPLATAVMVDGAFQAYTGGVFDEHTTHFDWINHGVVIIGWDDSKGAWLIKNSWGPSWGEMGGSGSERGYMWIAYNTNNIGIATAWVDATSNKYQLISAWDHILKNLRVTVQPLPVPIQ